MPPAPPGSPDLLQLELPLQVSASAEFSVRRMASGAVVLTPAKLKLWGSVKDAARKMNRSERWVQIQLEAGRIRGRRIDGRGKWDVDMLHVQEILEEACNQEDDDGKA